MGNIIFTKFGLFEVFNQIFLDSFLGCVCF